MTALDPARAPGLDAVQLLRWPAEATRRDPQRWPACLWLLPVGELAPELGELEDWVRVPSDERDVAARARRLATKALGPPPLRPGDLQVDAGGRVAWRGRSMLVPPTEAALLAVLADAAGSIVPRATLARAAWGDGATPGRRLDSRLFALRGRLAPLGLVIHTVRGRGCLLTTDSADHPNAPRGRGHHGGTP